MKNEIFNGKVYVNKTNNQLKIILSKKELLTKMNSTELKKFAIDNKKIKISFWSLK